MTLCRDEVNGKLSIVVYHKSSIILIQPLDFSNQKMIEFDPHSWEHSSKVSNIDDFRLFEVNHFSEGDYIRLTLINSQSDLMTRLIIDSKDYFRHANRQFSNTNPFTTQPNLLLLHKGSKRLNPLVFPYCRSVAFTTSNTEYLYSNNLINGDLVLIFLIDDDLISLKIYSLIDTSIVVHQVNIKLFSSFFDYPFITLFSTFPIIELNGELIFIFHDWFLYVINTASLSVCAVFSFFPTNSPLIYKTEYSELPVISLTSDFVFSRSLMPLLSISRDLVLFVSTFHGQSVGIFQLKIHPNNSGVALSLSLRRRYFNSFNFISFRMPLVPSDSALSSPLNHVSCIPMDVKQTINQILSNVDNHIVDSLNDALEDFKINNLDQILDLVVQRVQNIK
ncbi:hypothetical protein RCL1_004715 [Eukaryota sp. TZLM3-RCL]